MQLAANTSTQTTVNVTHFSESLAASFWPSPLEQKSLTPCLLVKCGGALHAANALPLPGDLPSKPAVLKLTEVAGAALTPTLPVNGRFSWVWNNSLSATVDRKCNISIPSIRVSGRCNDSTAEWRKWELKGTVPDDERRLFRSSNGFFPPVTQWYTTYP